MKKLFLLIFIFISCITFAKSDVDIYKVSMSRFDSCVSSNKKLTSDCAVDLQNDFNKLSNNGFLRVFALQKARSYYELFIKLERGYFSNSQDAIIMMNNINTTFEQEITQIENRGVK